MALAPRRSCLQPHCPKDATKHGRCADHQRPERSEQAREWGALYNTARWRAYRLAYLAEHPLCVACPLTPASVVDHKRPHKGDAALFWDEGNHQSMCGPCHSAKTAREDGGFGR